MDCELEKPNPTSFGSTAVKTDSGTTAIHTFSSVHDAHSGNRVEIRVRTHLRAGKKQAQATVLMGIFLSTFPCTLLR